MDIVNRGRSRAALDPPLVKLQYSFVQAVLQIKKILLDRRYNEPCIIYSRFVGITI